MERGDKVTVPFGNGEKEGTVFKVFPKTVYIKVDFPNHKGKILKRSITAVQSMKEGKKAKAKQKTKAPKEGRKKEKPAKKSTK